MFSMKKKMPTPIKDGIIGMAFGIAAIIPGIAGGTVLLITGAFKKVAGAVANLFSKDFFRNLIILLPFGIGAILAFGGLIIPINLALENCMFAIVCLFAGLIIGTLPSITDKVKGVPIRKSYIIALVVSLVAAALIGAISLIFKTHEAIDKMFEELPFYLYILVFVVGFICASGLIVPGLSGSMLLLALCFYQPILGLFKFDNVLENFALIFIFLIGAIIGFVFFSKIINHFVKTHLIGAYYCSIGLIIGSLVAVFINGKMFEYIRGPHFDLIDKILGPCLFVVAVIVGYLSVIYIRKHPKTEEENAEN